MAPQMDTFSEIKMHIARRPNFLRNYENSGYDSFKVPLLTASGPNFRVIVATV